MVIIQGSNTHIMSRCDFLWLLCNEEHFAWSPSPPISGWRGLVGWVAYPPGRVQVEQPLLHHQVVQGLRLRLENEKANTMFTSLQPAWQQATQGAATPCVASPLTDVLPGNLSAPHWQLPPHAVIHWSPPLDRPPLPSHWVDEQPWCRQLHLKSNLHHIQLSLSHDSWSVWKGFSRASGTRLPPSCFRSSLRYVKMCKVAFSNLDSKWLTTTLL